MKNWTTLALILGFIVVMLGAYTRLTDAGLGCPDWPGCYGHMVLPEAKVSLEKAQANFPAIPIQARKAWTEMIHRYLAGTLGLLIFGIGITAGIKRLKQGSFPWKIPVFLMIFVIFQALLGMWTVTWKLLPIVVMAHLLGGMLIVGFLALYRMQLSPNKALEGRFRMLVSLGIIIVFFQIALGGWVSANYAGIACVGFPKCNGVWLPALDFSQGFYLFSPVGANYSGGFMKIDARMTIQLIHRIGAVITLLYILGIGYYICAKAKYNRLRQFSLLISFLVSFQFVLGIINVVYFLPLSVAVMHNGVAAFLFAALFSMLPATRRSVIHAD